MLLCIWSLFSRVSFIKASVKNFQHRAPSSKRAAWARTRTAAYRARRDSSYLSVEDQYPLSFQRSRRASRPRSPISRSVSPSSRASPYRSSSPVSLGAGLREATAEVGDSESHPMVGVSPVIPVMHTLALELESGTSKYSYPYIIHTHVVHCKKFQKKVTILTPLI